MDIFEVPQLNYCHWQLELLRNTMKRFAFNLTILSFLLVSTCWAGIIQQLQAVKDDDDDEGSDEPVEVQSALDYGVRPHQNPSINVGSTFKLSVDLSKISSSVITWSRDGQPLLDSQRIDIDIVNGVASLMVMDAVLSDSGVYTVKADNVALGSAFADFELDVQEDKGFLWSEMQRSK